MAIAGLIFLCTGSVWSARIQDQKTTATILPKGDETPDYLISPGISVFQTTIHSPYDTILGYTWYDYQHNSRMPRMNANDYHANRGLHFTFMELVYQDPMWSRYATYNYRDAGGWAVTPPPSARITRYDAYAGYTGLDLIRPLAGDKHSRAVVFYHTNVAIIPDPEPYFVTLSIEPDSAGKIDFQSAHYWYDIPDYLGTDVHGMWPACAVDSLNRIHVVMRSGTPGLLWFGYIRCAERPGDTLMCWAPGEDSVLLTKETFYTDQDYPVALVDQSETVSQSVIASKVSNKVTIFWSAPAESETDSTLFQYCNDIYYIESTSGGDDWFTARSMPAPLNLTKYGSDDYVRAYGDLSGIYDLNDSLHLFWHTHYYDQTSVYFDFNTAALWHWSKATQRICNGDTLVANKVTSGGWMASPGKWNRLFSKMQAGIGILPDTNLNYLYLQWTQFDSLTESDQGFSQGDIYISLSTDLGLSWQSPVNVTKSTVPNCETGECASDHWSSMAERVDSCVYMQWIYDLDAGGYPHLEGMPTENPVLFRAFPIDSVPIIEAARISWSPGSFADPYVRLSLNQIDTLYLTIDNVGTKDLDNISLSSGAEGDWLTIDPCPSSIPKGGCPATVALTLTAGSQEVFRVDSIRIQSNDQVGNHDVYLRMHVIVSDTFKENQFAIIQNPTFKVSVSNTGNLGCQNDTAGFYMHQDPNHPNFLYDGSIVIGYTNPESDTLVGRHFFDKCLLHPATDLQVDTNSQYQTITTHAEFWPVQIPPADQWWPWWRVKVKNLIFYSTYQTLSASDDEDPEYILLKTIQFFHNQPPEWWGSVTPPETIPATYLGLVLDIDSPSELGVYNYPHLDQTRRMAYLQGYGGANEYYRMAVAQKDPCYEFAPDSFACWPDPGYLDFVGEPVDTPYGMHILRNDAFIYPEDGFRNDSLYKYMSMTGYSIYGNGEPADYSILTSGAFIPEHSYPDYDTFEISYALVLSDEYEIVNLNTVVDGIICGNLNGDGELNVSDVVYLVNYVWRSGPPPTWPYIAEINNDGILDAVDMVYLVNYLFKSGPPPMCSALEF